MDNRTQTITLPITFGFIPVYPDSLQNQLVALNNISRPIIVLPDGTTPYAHNTQSRTAEDTYHPNALVLSEPITARAVAKQQGWFYFAPGEEVEKRDSSKRPIEMQTFIGALEATAKQFGDSRKAKDLAENLSRLKEEAQAAVYREIHGRNLIGSHKILLAGSLKDSGVFAEDKREYHAVREREIETELSTCEAGHLGFRTARVRIIPYLVNESLKPEHIGAAIALAEKHIQGNKIDRTKIHNPHNLGQFSPKDLKGDIMVESTTLEGISTEKLTRMADTAARAVVIGLKHYSDRINRRLERADDKLTALAARLYAPEAQVPKQ